MFGVGLIGGWNYTDTAYGALKRGRKYLPNSLLDTASFSGQLGTTPILKNQLFGFIGSFFDDKSDRIILVFINEEKQMLDVSSYFDGKVKSIGFDTDTLPATVGVMSRGEYTFGTSEFEKMTVITGALIVKLPGEGAWKEYAAGDSFAVEANVEFQVKVANDTSYLCTYG